MTINPKRIESVDLLRGLAMVLMALDHVRDFFHFDAYFFEPTDLTQTNIALFWTRFITHFCAPAFVFLAGTSTFFVGQRTDKKSLSVWLLKRGFWLVFVEVTIIKFAWFFQLDYTSLLLQVIWVLGLSMIFLAGFIHLSKKLVIGLSIIVIFGHNLFDTFVPTGEMTTIIWGLLHVFGTFEIASIKVESAYPIIPWVFVMPLGYYFGALFLPTVKPEYRVQKLRQVGLGLLISFFVIRFFNFYGDPTLWSLQNSMGLTIASFFNLNKYPPSLLFLLITLGSAILFLSLAEKWDGRIAKYLITIGRVPMFFYIVHIYLIHLFAMIAAQLTGFHYSDMIINVWITFEPQLKGYGFKLSAVYMIWIFLIVILYPVSAWYNNYKSNNRDKWWLRYL